MPLRRVDQIDPAQVPAGVAHHDLAEVTDSVPGPRNARPPARSCRRSAAAAAWLPGETRRGGRRSRGWRGARRAPGRSARPASRTVSRCTARLYSISTHACVASLRKSSVNSGVAVEHLHQPALERCPRRPLACRSGRGCRAGSARERSPGAADLRVTSSAIIAAPLSVSSARGRPRFWIAWESPCTRSSAVSERYHWRWQHSREWSSRMPRASGRCHWPRGREHLEGAVVEIEMPQGADVLGFVAADLARLRGVSARVLRRGGPWAAAGAGAPGREPACSAGPWHTSAAAPAPARPSPARPGCRSATGSSSAGGRGTGGADARPRPWPATPGRSPCARRGAGRRPGRPSHAARCSTSARW